MLSEISYAYAICDSMLSNIFIESFLFHLLLDIKLLRKMKFYSIRGWDLLELLCSTKCHSKLESFCSVHQTEFYYLIIFQFSISTLNAMPIFIIFKSTTAIRRNSYIWLMFSCYLIFSSNQWVKYVEVFCWWQRQWQWIEKKSRRKMNKLSHKTADGISLECTWNVCASLHFSYAFIDNASQEYYNSWKPFLYEQIKN